MLKSADKSESLLGAGQSLCVRACGPRHLCWGGPAVCRGRGHVRPPGVPASGSAPLSSVWAAGLPGVASWGGTGCPWTSLELL